MNSKYCAVITEIVSEQIIFGIAGHLVDRMMEYCGFTEGAGRANNLLIDAAMHNGALGAKLTGAGGGGSVFALVRPGDETRVADCMLHAAHENGLDRANVFVTRPTATGLTIKPLASD